MRLLFAFRITQTSGSSEWRIQQFCSRRLDSIADVLGDERFNAVIAKTEAQWNQKFADADRKEASLAPCKSCGSARVLYDLAYAPADLCAQCAHSNRSFKSCTNCGRQYGVGRSADTGDLCWDCASDRLAPCTKCGGKRSLGFEESESDLCDTCLMATIPPCKCCGAIRNPWSVSTENDDGYCRDCAW